VNAARRQTLYTCLGLVLLNLLVYAQTAGFDFINFDDGILVYDNPRLAGGLAPTNIVWAFSVFLNGHWHPLTLLSYLADYEIHGLNPGGFHLTNLLLHVANTIALFLVLRGLTCRFWTSAFIAAVFAVHPLHVESVAWISERKGLLSALFWITAIGAYTAYARRGAGAWYALSLLLFTLSLMSKAVAMPLPFILLLLDFWPLNRFGREGPGLRRLLLEKLPYLALAVAMGVVVILSSIAAHTLGATDTSSFVVRLINAVRSYTSYVELALLPRNLACFYPFVYAISPTALILRLGVLLGITVLAWALRHRHPYLFVGWFWFLLTLAPVIGILQAGSQALADRYMYLPLIGLAIMLAFGASAAAGGGRWRRRALAGGALGVVALLAAAAWVQTTHWRSSLTVFNHALQVTDNNYMAHVKLGEAYINEGKYQRAMRHINASLDILPAHPALYAAIPALLLEHGQLDAAIAVLKRGVEVYPASAELHRRIGEIELQRGRARAAVKPLEAALAIDPNDAHAHHALGVAYAALGAAAEAERELRAALSLQPGWPQLHASLGELLAATGKRQEARAAFERALQLDPGFGLARQKLNELEAAE
jgi:Flp pilus assembly protein TadD